MVKALPGSLSEGVYFGERKRSKISELICAGGKSLAWRNHRTTLPQSRPCGRASSLREGAGNGLHHSTECSLKSQVAGDFHRPYETLMILDFTIHRSTLPQSATLTAPSGREPGGVRTIHPTTQKPEGCGRFSSPLRKLRNFYILLFNSIAQKIPIFLMGGENGRIF